MLPPEQAAELLPWYMQWSRDLAGEMHQRRLVRDKARRADTLPTSYRPCDCTADWRCEPHDACFIHDSCFCPGSSSFPPVKPPRSQLSSNHSESLRFGSAGDRRLIASYCLALPRVLLPRIIVSTYTIFQDSLLFSGYRLVTGLILGPFPSAYIRWLWVA